MPGASDSVDPWDLPKPPRRRLLPQRTGPLPTWRRARRRGIGVAIAVALAAAAVLLLVPVPQSRSEWFSIFDPGDGARYYGENQTFPAGGTFSFSWQASARAGVTLTVLDPSGTTIYSQVNQSSSGTLTVVGGGAYLFAVYSSVRQTVNISGTLQFSGPLL